MANSASAASASATAAACITAFSFAFASNVPPPSVPFPQSINDWQEFLEVPLPHPLCAELVEVFRHDGCGFVGPPEEVPEGRQGRGYVPAEDGGGDGGDSPAGHAQSLGEGGPEGKGVEATNAEG